MQSLDINILKTLLSNKKYALEFINEYDSKMFSSEVWNFANILINYIKTYKDIPTQRIMQEKIKGNDKLLEYINKTWDQINLNFYDEKEYKHDLEKLKKRFAENQLLSVKETFNKLEAGGIDINKTVLELQKTVQTIKGLDQKKAFEVKSIKEYLPIFVDKFNAKKNNPNVDRGLMTKYSFLDYATNGLKPADFVIIAGESGFGKSLFLNNIAIQVWLQDNKISFQDPQDNSKLTDGRNIIYFSLEMPYEDCFNRLLSRLSGVPSRKIENSDLTKNEFEKLKMCLDFIKNYPYTFKIVDITEACANDLEAILNDAGESFDAIFVDYLGIMKPNTGGEEQDWLRQGEISQQLRAVCRRYEKPLFSAVQLNRKAQGKETENIGLSRLARSATIATHATHVVQIEKRQEEEKNIDFIYHLIKNRKGPKGHGILIKNLACATLVDKPLEEKKDNDKETDYENYFKDQDDISEEIEDLEL